MTRSHFWAKLIPVLLINCRTSLERVGLVPKNQVVIVKESLSLVKRILLSCANQLLRVQLLLEVGKSSLIHKVLQELLVTILSLFLLFSFS